MPPHTNTSQRQGRLPGLDRPLAIVDIETTGGSVTRDRITEIGIVVWMSRACPGPVALAERLNPELADSPHTLLVLDNWCLLATLSGEGEPDWSVLGDIQQTPGILDRDIYRYLRKELFEPPRNICVVAL